MIDESDSADVFILVETDKSIWFDREFGLISFWKVIWVRREYCDVSWSCQAVELNLVLSGIARRSRRRVMKNKTPHTTFVVRDTKIRRQWHIVAIFRRHRGLCMTLNRYLIKNVPITWSAIGNMRKKLVIQNLITTCATEMPFFLLKNTHLFYTFAPDIYCK